MDKLPVCKLCGSPPIQSNRFGRPMVFHNPQSNCPMRLCDFVKSEQWAALMGGWLPIESVTIDEPPHVRIIPVYEYSVFSHYEADVGYIDEDSGVFVDVFGNPTGWDADDYTHWQPLPPAPEQESEG